LTANLSLSCLIIRPCATNFSRHFSFNWTGQSMDSSTRLPTGGSQSEVKRSPELLIFTVSPLPPSIAERLLNILNCSLQRMGNRLDFRRSRVPTPHMFTESSLDGCAKKASATISYNSISTWLPRTICELKKGRDGAAARKSRKRKTANLLDCFLSLRRIEGRLYWPQRSSSTGSFSK
jgi:hypothetical protein